MPNTRLNLGPDAFMQIAEQALTGFVIFNMHTKKCQYANQVARETLGLKDDLEEVSLENFYPDTPTNNRFRTLSEELVNFEGLFQEIVIKKLTGQKIVCSLGVRKLSLTDGDNKPVSCVVLMIQDMTVQVKLQREVESKQMQITAAYQELLSQNQQLKTLDLAKNRFIALITHELRTPVSGIVASSEVLKMGLYDNDQQRDEFIAMIHTEGNHLLELVNDVLDFAKIQAGKMDFYVEQKDLAKVVQHEIDLLQNMAAQHSINIVFCAPGEGGAVCYFDELRVKQVVANIVNNAIKYNKPNGQVHIWFKNENGNVELHVKDTGKGIEPDNVSKVFNEFETLGKISLHNKGTGLGMPITKRLLEGMGGTIQLQSTVGIGTTFWITLPVTKVLAEEMYRSRPGGEDVEDLAA